MFFELGTKRPLRHQVGLLSRSLLAAVSGVKVQGVVGRRGYRPEYVDGGSLHWRIPLVNP